jgi:hypothetical protein
MTAAANNPAPQGLAQRPAHGLRLLLAWQRWPVASQLALMAAILGLAAWLMAQRHAGNAPAQRRAELLSARQALQAARPALATASTDRPGGADPLGAFYATLGNPDALPVALGDVFDAAKAGDLDLAEARYQSTFDLVGQIERHQVRLPVKGSYRQIRTFCWRVLGQLPFASLDAITLQRTDSDSDQLEAVIRFSIFLDARDRLPLPSSKGSRP